MYTDLNYYMIDRKSRFDEFIELMYRNRLEQREMTATQIYSIMGGEKFASPKEITTLIGNNTEDKRIQKIDISPKTYKIQKSGPC